MVLIPRTQLACTHSYKRCRRNHQLRHQQRHQGHTLRTAFAENCLQLALTHQAHTAMSLLQAMMLEQSCNAPPIAGARKRMVYFKCNLRT